MVETLEHGKCYETRRCKHCNCLFTYNKLKDSNYTFEIDEDGARVDRKYIYCPECAMKYYLDGKEAKCRNGKESLAKKLLVNLIVVTVIFSIVYAFMIALGWLLTDNMRYFMDGVIFTAIVSTIYDLVAKKFKSITRQKGGE